MGTIVFLTHRYFDNFHFDKIVDKNDRLVCIILDSQQDKFPEKLRARFNEIYPAPRFKLSHGALVKFDHNSIKKSSKRS